MARPKDIGTAAETAVVKFLRANGFPHAERRALTGSLDQGDVTGTPGICWEVKGGEKAKTASDGQVALWMAETETERVNAKADIGVLVMARAGIGPVNAGRWWAVLRLDDLQGLPYGRPEHPGAAAPPSAPVRVHLDTAVQLLRAAGYGQAITQNGATA